MARVTNKFYIKAIHDGSTVFAEMLNNNPDGGFVQQIDSAGVCDPNWNAGETGAVTPILFPHIKLNGKSKSCTGFIKDPNNTERIITGADKGWTYNGAAISWTTVGNKKYYQISDGGTTINLFELIESYSYDGVTVPALKIIHNLAGINGNIDNDIITFDGAAEEDGHQTTFSVGQAIRITQFVGGGYTSNMYGSDTITTANKTAVVYAQLFYNSLNNPVDPSEYTTNWYREGIDGSTAKYHGTGVSSATDVKPAGNADTVTVRAKSHYITVPEVDITDRVVLRCDFILTDGTTISNWFEIDDQVDEEVMYLVCDSQDYISKDYIELHEGQTARMKAWMATKENETIEYSKGGKKYNEFWCKLFDQENTILESGAPFSGLTEDTDPTSPTYKCFDITKTGNNAVVYKDKANTQVLINPDYCGEISIGYDFVDSPTGGKGGITGHVIALSTQIV